MAQDKIRLPSSEGGLVRYSDEEYHSRFPLKPEYVIGFGVAVVVVFILVLALHLY